MKLEREITIYNEDAQREIDLSSSNGYNFSFDLGESTLTCQVYDTNEPKQDLTNKYQYSWSFQDFNNHFINLTENQYVSTYNYLISELNSTFNNYEEPIVDETEEQVVRVDESLIDKLISYATIYSFKELIELFESFNINDYIGLGEKYSIESVQDLYNFLVLILNTIEKTDANVKDRKTLLQVAFDAYVNEDYIDLSEPVVTDIYTVEGNPQLEESYYGNGDGKIYFLPQNIYEFIYRYCLDNITDNFTPIVESDEYNEALEKATKQFLLDYEKLTVVSEFNKDKYQSVLKQYKDTVLTDAVKTAALNAIDAIYKEQFDALKSLNSLGNIFSEEEYKLKEKVIEGWKAEARNFIIEKASTKAKIYNIVPDFNTSQAIEGKLGTIHINSSLAKQAFLSKLKNTTIGDTIKDRLINRREDIKTSISFVYGKGYKEMYPILLYLYSLEIASKTDAESRRIKDKANTIFKNYENNGIDLYAEEGIPEFFNSWIVDGRVKPYTYFKANITNIARTLYEVGIFNNAEYSEPQTSKNAGPTVGRMWMFKYFENNVLVTPSSENLNIKSESSKSVLYKIPKEEIDEKLQGLLNVLDIVYYYGYDKSYNIYKEQGGDLSPESFFLGEKKDEKYSGGFYSDYVNYLNASAGAGDKFIENTLTPLFNSIKNSKEVSIQRLYFPKAFLYTIMNYNDDEIGFNNIVSTFSSWCYLEPMKKLLTKVYKVWYNDNIKQIENISEDYLKNQADFINPINGKAISDDYETVGIFLNGYTANLKNVFEFDINLDKDETEEIYIRKSISLFEKVNKEYNITDDKVELLKDAIIKSLKDEETEFVIELPTQQKKYSNKNQLKVNVSGIADSATFMCSVYTQNGVFIGSEQVRLVNSKSTDRLTLRIVGGDQVFKYSDGGVSPTASYNEFPQKIATLSYEIIDSGNPLIVNVPQPNEVSGVHWGCPTEKTLIKELNVSPDKTSAEFDIMDSFNPDANNNQISLSLVYKNVPLSTETTFTFLKNGDLGTNGSDYYLKVYPYNNKEYVTAVLQERNEEYRGTFDNMGDTSIDNGVIPFYASLYKNGAEVLSTKDNVGSREASIDGELTWDFIQNLYDRNNDDKDNVLFDTVLGRITFNNLYLGNIDRNDLFTVDDDEIEIKNYNNILRCTFTPADTNEKIISSVAPITTIIKQYAAKDYRIEVSGGFRSVQYATNCMQPQYSTSEPFTISIVQDGVECNNLKEFTYDWGILGTVDRGLPSNDLIDDVRKNNQYIADNNKYQHYYLATPKYSGLCVNNAVTCVIKQKGELFAIVSIPVYFFVNKHGLADINGWDGTSIQLNEDGGRILSQQIGAGKKDVNNGFTGVLMGEVLEPMRNTSDIGLLGYYQGERSFFVDSETGGAIFGRGASGSIVVDPSLQTNAFIYGGNYFLPEYHKENGFLNLEKISDVTDLTNIKDEDSNGLLIDFTNSRIDYANGTFSVNSDGMLYSTGGTIGGWSIDSIGLTATKKTETDGSLTSTEEVYKFTLYGNEGKDYTVEQNKETEHKKSLTQKNDTFLDITQTSSFTIYKYDNAADSSKDSVLKLGSIEVEEDEKSLETVFSGTIVESGGGIIRTPSEVRVEERTVFSVMKNGDLLARDAQFGQADDNPVKIVASANNSYIKCDAEIKSYYIGLDGIVLKEKDKANITITPSGYITMEKSLTTKNGNIYLQSNGTTNITLYSDGKIVAKSIQASGDSLFFKDGSKQVSMQKYITTRIDKVNDKFSGYAKKSYVDDKFKKCLTSSSKIT